MKQVQASNHSIVRDIALAMRARRVPHEAAEDCQRRPRSLVTKAFARNAPMRAAPLSAEISGVLSKAIVELEVARLLVVVSADSGTQLESKIQERCATASVLLVHALALGLLGLGWPLPSPGNPRQRPGRSLGGAPSLLQAIDLALAGLASIQNDTRVASVADRLCATVFWAYRQADLAVLLVPSAERNGARMGGEGKGEAETLCPARKS